jgi:hypothetical protein
MYFPCLLVLDRSQVTRSYAVNEPSSFPSLQKILIRLWVYDSSLAHLAQVQPASFLRGKDSIFPVFKCKQTRKKNIECKIILHTVICSTGGMLQTKRDKLCHTNANHPNPRGRNEFAPSTKRCKVWTETRNSNKVYMRKCKISNPDPNFCRAKFQSRYPILCSPV